MGEVGEEEEDQEDFLVGTGGGGGDGVRGRAVPLARGQGHS